MIWATWLLFLSHRSSLTIVNQLSKSEMWSTRLLLHSSVKLPLKVIHQTDGWSVKNCSKNVLGTLHSCVTYVFMQGCLFRFARCFILRMTYSLRICFDLDRCFIWSQHCWKCEITLYSLCYWQSGIKCCLILQST